MCFLQEHPLSPPEIPLRILQVPVQVLRLFLLLLSVHPLLPVVHLWRLSDLQSCFPTELQGYLQLILQALQRSLHYPQLQLLRLLLQVPLQALR